MRRGFYLAMSLCLSTPFAAEAWTIFKCVAEDEIVIMSNEIVLISNSRNSDNPKLSVTEVMGAAACVAMGYNYFALVDGEVTFSSGSSHDDRAPVVPRQTGRVYLAYRFYKDDSSGRISCTERADDGAIRRAKKRVSKLRKKGQC